mmetsp:Transcript_41679/g.65040  ORF Transcript_41679/g.65040 Transcript_41679/m.65040 type:complete len:192 (-) Transcript_41679:1190-1765(-)
MLKAHEVLKELKKEWLPASVAHLIDTPDAVAAGATPEQHCRRSQGTGLGLGAMIGKPGFRHGGGSFRRVGSKDSAQDEVAISVGATDSSFATTNASESEGEDSWLWESWKETTGGSPSYHKGARTHKCETSSLRDGDSASYGVFQPHYGTLPCVEQHLVLKWPVDSQAQKPHPFGVLLQLTPTNWTTHKMG